ncbi:MAG: DMT family transporter [Anaerolineaceae bacterium]|nr:DMT family transporter [Anaerolineaceae bacterium]
MRLAALLAVGILAGACISIQGVLNSDLGKRIGNFGSVLALSIVTALVIIVLILVFPGTANLKNLPGLKDSYLYLGGILGIGIIAAPIFLIPRIGVTATLSGMVIGQLFLAVLIDQFGILGAQKIPADLTKMIGVLLLIFATFLITKK